MTHVWNRYTEVYMDLPYRYMYTPRYDPSHFAATLSTGWSFAIALAIPHRRNTRLITLRSSLHHVMERGTKRSDDGHPISLKFLVVYWFNFYAPEVEDRGAYCFCPVCHSVLLSETLTLQINFEQWALDLWYFTWVFLVIRPFHGFHYF